ncbi:glycosyltransferase family 4 protein [Azospirillum sp. sgz302134]
MAMSLLLWHWGRTGGGPKFTLELARALKDRGNFNLHLSLPKQSELFEASQELGLPGFHIDVLQGQRGSLKGILDAALAVPRVMALGGSFGRYLEENKIDIVLSTMGTIWHPTMLRPIRRSGASFVHIVHDAVAHPGDYYPFREKMAVRELMAADGLIALSEHVRQQVHSVRGYPLERIWLARHGVFEYGTQTRGPRPYPANGPFRLLFFGRIVEYKGLSLLLDAYELVKARHPRVELHVYGSGNMQPYKEKLARLPDVHVDNGWIPEDKIGDILDNVDCLVLPYLEASQSGVVTVAYGAAKPVVATPVGGLCEQVRADETGVLASAVSVEALAAALERLITDKNLYEHCSRGARAFADRELSWDAIAGDVEKCLYEVKNLPATPALEPAEAA